MAPVMHRITRILKSCCIVLWSQQILKAQIDTILCIWAGYRIVATKVEQYKWHCHWHSLLMQHHLSYYRISKDIGVLDADSALQPCNLCKLRVWLSYICTHGSWGPVSKVYHFLCPRSVTKLFTFRTLLMVKECRTPRGILDPAACPHCSKFKMLLSSRSSLTYSYNDINGIMHTQSS